MIDNAITPKVPVVDVRYRGTIIEFDITVPVGFNPALYIDEESINVQKDKTTFFYNKDLNSKNFAGTTTTLIPGKTYGVKLIPKMLTTTSEEDIDFLLKEPNAILVGAHGLMLAYSQHKDMFPKVRNIISFDQKDGLWKDEFFYHRVPKIRVDWSGDFYFELSLFENKRGIGYYLLCFYEK